MSLMVEFLTRSRVRARLNGGAYRMARGFGRGRAVAAWLQLRFAVTGRTGRYRIGTEWRKRNEPTNGS